MDTEFEGPGVFLLWLAFVTVVGYWVVRIALLILRQRHAERYYREMLAISKGAIAREQAAARLEDRTG